MNKVTSINSKLPKQFNSFKILSLVRQGYTYLVDSYSLNQIVNLVDNCIHIMICQIIISGCN